MNLTNEQIGQRIKEVRTEKNITQTQLAKFLGKSLRTVQSYESGESRIFFDTVCSIANFLGVTPSYLLGFEEPQMQLNSLSDVIAVSSIKRKSYILMWTSNTSKTTMGISPLP